MLSCLLSSMTKDTVKMLRSIQYHCSRPHLCVVYAVLADKVVVGSYMGMLRLFSPHSSKAGEGAQSQADHQLLEVQLPHPIIQVEVGKFVS